MTISMIILILLIISLTYLSFEIISMLIYKIYNSFFENEATKKITKKIFLKRLKLNIIWLFFSFISLISIIFFYSIERIEETFDGPGYGCFEMHSDFDLGYRLVLFLNLIFIYKLTMLIISIFQIFINKKKIKKEFFKRKTFYVFIQLLVLIMINVFLIMNLYDLTILNPFCSNDLITLKQSHIITLD